MAKRRPGLWTETAFGLALVTLVAIVLSAGVAGVLFKAAESERRTEMAQRTARVLRAQLEVEALTADPGYQRVLRAYANTVPPDGEIWLVDASAQPVVVVQGKPVSTLDAGVRSALFSKQEHMEAVGSRLGERHVRITTPVMRGSTVIGALRYSARLDAAGPFGGQWSLFLLYVVGSTVLVAGFGFVVFRRRLVQPILEIQQSTHVIARGQFGQEVVVEGPSELTDLAAALTTLSASLKSYRESSQSQLRELESANAELKSVQGELIRSEKLAGIGRLAAGIAHEVGNPLAAVVGYVDILIEGVDDEELKSDVLQRSRRELQRIQSIIGDLLDYARPDELPFKPVEVAELLDEAVKRVKLMSRFADADIALHVSEGLPQIWIQRERVHQVLLNLMLNAADAIGGTGEILLSAEQVDGKVELACRDSGPGISPDNLPKVFDPFFTTKEPGGGTGLGLAISHRIANSQRGELIAENHPAGGAVFRFRLPEVAE